MTQLPFTRIDRVPDGARVVYIDASSLTLANCQQKYSFAIVHGYREKAVNEFQCFGKAVHKFAEFAKRGDTAHGLVAARAEWARFSADTKQLIAVCGSMPAEIPNPYEARVEICPGNDEVLPMLEWWFEIPYLLYTPDDGTPPIAFVLCGTIDLIAFVGGVVKLHDYKTSRKWKKEEIFASYANDTQQTFYLFACYRFGHLFMPDELAQAAAAGMITAQIIAVQVSKTPPAWLTAPPQPMDAAKADRFEANLQMHIYTDILPAWLNPDAAAMNGWVSGQCGMCQFNRVCHTPDAKMRETLLTGCYDQKPYNPKHHSK